MPPPDRTLWPQQSEVPLVSRVARGPDVDKPLCAAYFRTGTGEQEDDFACSTYAEPQFDSLSLQSPSEFLR